MFLIEDAEGKITSASAEGVRTRVLYLNEAGDTPLMVQRNYQVVLDQLGTVKELYACKPGECSGHKISTTLWTKDAMIPIPSLRKPRYLLGFSTNFTDASDRYARVTIEDGLLHIGVFAGEVALKNSNSELRDRTVALIEVIQVADFSPTLEFIDAAEMQSEISASGHVALYGPQFDHDKATLTSESATTIEEVGNALREDDDLALYVVGHSDEVGDLAYNQELSQRRAQAAVLAGAVQPLTRNA